MMKKSVSSRSLLLCLLVGFATMVSIQRAGAREIPVAEGLTQYDPWDEEIVDLFRKIPVQDDGRIKPLETVARFRLYRINGKRSLTFGVEEAGEVRKVKLNAVEWYLDCLFRPEVATKLPFILVDNVDVITDIGLEPHISGSGNVVLRSRYAYDELQPAMPQPGNPENRGKLSEKRDEYLAAKQEDPEAFSKDMQKQQLLDLHDRVAVLNYLLHMNDFARGGLIPGVPIGKISASLGDPEAETTPLSEWLEKWQKIPAAALAEGTYDATAVRNMMQQLALELERIANIAGADPQHPIAGIALFAPDAAEDDDWRTIGEEIVKAAEAEEPYTAGIERVKVFEELVSNSGDQKAFKAVLAPFVEQRIAEAEARGEYSKVPMELSYYKAHFIANAMPWFIFGFVFVALSWLTPGSVIGKYLGRASVLTCLLGLGYVTGAIIMRCLIMGRPPISTLYETILFITASAVLLCLILEYFDRKKVALAAAAVIGAAGMFLALRYEMKEALEGRGDTMVTLQAVLRSNFWLGTHVIIINLGYASALLAAVLSMIYIGSRLIHGGAPDDDRERGMTRMVYGIICFTLLFSLVGTVLGGIWANDSWGRFWGWDPKENGALMIVLWSLVILHARMGGYIKRVGIHAGSIMLGIITVFSWWGVNELDVGLHSYGRTSGVAKILMTVYLIAGAVILLGGVVWLMERAAQQARSEAKPKKQDPGDAEEVKA
ncbi:MAG: cytochrome c biogenesis protein [Verrucomicrobiales bacterium]